MRTLVMVDLSLGRHVFQCPCNDCREQLRDSVALDHQAINRVMATLDEKQRRLFAGLLAMRLGHGGIITLAVITGLSRTTIRRGITELRLGIAGSERRVRRQGGGRPRLEKKIRRS
jgi:hypothetical protein